MSRRLTLAAITLCCAVSAFGQSLFYQFTNPPRGPRGLVANGTTLFGVTSDGGRGGSGEIFNFETAGGPPFTFPSGAFDPLNGDGTTPMAPPVLSGGFLWGTTNYEGGGCGSIYRADISNPYNALIQTRGRFDCSGSVNYPTTSLTPVGSVFYGTTSPGAVYKFDPSDNSITAVATLDNATIGTTPSALVAYGSYLYGTTQTGGPNNLGTLFRFDPVGHGVTDMYDFGSGGGSAPWPASRLLVVGSLLYGTTYQGGTFNNGTIYKFDPSNGNVTTLYSFTGSEGRLPKSGLASSGSYLYGNCSSGGTSSRGTVFEFDPVGLTITKFATPPANTFSSNPDTTMVAVGSYLYGTSPSGYGSIYRYEPATNTITNAATFYGTSDGYSLPGPVTAVGSFLYGMTEFGGNSDLGTVFKIDLTKSAFGPQCGQTYCKQTTFTQLTNTLGGRPLGGLLPDSGFLWGTTSLGGSYGAGTVIKIDPTTLSVTKIASFTGFSYNPVGTLLASGGFYYGVTQYGGSNGYGAIFKVDPLNLTITYVASFDATTGGYPASGLVAVGSYFYGAGGTVFKFDPMSNIITPLTPFSCGTDGSSPQGLTVSGGFLYGTTAYCGLSGGGTVFKIDPGNGSLTTLYNFLQNCCNGTKGYYPKAGVIASGGFLYGTTTAGGYDGRGTVYKLDPNSLAVTPLLSFVASSGYVGAYCAGEMPTAPLFAGGSYLYGTTSGGGDNGGGVVFNNNTPPAITGAGGITRTIGSAGTSSTIATVNDYEDPAGTLTVTPTSIPTGVTITNITNNNGTVTATVTATCSAVVGGPTVPLQVQDSGHGAADTYLFGMAILANPAPVLGNYNDYSVNAGVTSTAYPSAPPSDNGTVTVTVNAAAGAGTVTADSATGNIQIVNPSAGSYLITVTATDNCGSTATKSFTLTVNPVFDVPQHFKATASGSSQVNLTWDAVSGVSPVYQIWRTTSVNTGFAQYASTSMTNYSDAGVSANTTYMYEIKAVDGGNQTNFTPVDVATTVAFTDDPLVAQTKAKSVHITQLRTAVNAMRAAAGLPATTFTDSAAAGTAIKALHITQLRTALSEARNTLGLSALTFTDPTLTQASTKLKMVHIQELRDGVK
jgi:uncharacterized repeat protein (TIGR03803 family)